MDVPIWQTRILKKDIASTAGDLGHCFAWIGELPGDGSDETAACAGVLAWPRPVGSVVDRGPQEARKIVVPSLR